MGVGQGWVQLCNCISNCNCLWTKGLIAIECKNLTNCVIVIVIDFIDVIDAIESIAFNYRKMP